MSEVFEGESGGYRFKVERDDPSMNPSKLAKDLGEAMARLSFAEKDLQKFSGRVDVCHEEISANEKLLQALLERDARISAGEPNPPKRRMDPMATYSTSAMGEYLDSLRSNLGVLLKRMEEATQRVSLEKEYISNIQEKLNSL